MKGVVLAGGLGTRLYPLTEVTNKHLLPVWNKPMIYYPLELMAACGIKDVMIVVGGKSTGEIVRLVKDGRKFGFKGMNYAYQEGEGGIAAALELTKQFVGNDLVFVVLGDNIVLEHEPIAEIVRNIQQFDDNDDLITPAHVILHRVPDIENYGAAQLGADKKVIQIIEKPKSVFTNLAVLGMYIYHGWHLFNAIKQCKPSERGELEISDVNNYFAQNGQLTYSIFNGWWGDAGESFEKYYDVSNYVREQLKGKPSEEFPELLKKG